MKKAHVRKGCQRHNLIGCLWNQKSMVKLSEVERPLMPIKVAPLPRAEKRRDIWQEFRLCLRRKI
jgi:hypothetical protein